MPDKNPEFFPYPYLAVFILSSTLFISFYLFSPDFFHCSWCWRQGPPLQQQQQQGGRPRTSTPPAPTPPPRQPEQPRTRAQAVLDLRRAPLRPDRLWRRGRRRRRGRTRTLCDHGPARLQPPAEAPGAEGDVLQQGGGRRSGGERFRGGGGGRRSIQLRIKNR